jgi:hypothetical protein
MALHNELYTNELITNSIRSNTGSINIGNLSTSSISIGKTGVTTETKGSLSVDEGIYIAENKREVDSKNGYGLLYKKDGGLWWRPDNLTEYDVSFYSRKVMYESLPVSSTDIDDSEHTNGDVLNTIVLKKGRYIITFSCSHTAGDGSISLVQYEGKEEFVITHSTRYISTSGSLHTQCTLKVDNSVNLCAVLTSTTPFVFRHRSLIAAPY